MKKILILIMLVLLSSIVAAQETYLTTGNNRNPTYQQDGTGLWAGRTPVTYDRAGNFTSKLPIVGDVDGDNINEIIVLTETNLKIYNYTTGEGLREEQSISYGGTVVHGDRFYITPALFDHDSDNDTEIIVTNMTHFLMYQYNGSTITLNQAAATGLNVSTMANELQVSSIKCAQSTQWAVGVDACAYFATEVSGAQYYNTAFVYDITNNTAYKGNSIHANANEDERYHSTHLADGDQDGYLEIYHAYNDAANGDLHVYESEFENPINVIPIRIILHNQAAGRPHTDIVVNDLFGNSGDLDITFGYSGDGTNFDAATYNADTGAVLDASYCTVLTCPEGNILSANMFVTDGQFGDYSGDACYYIRAYDDDGDTIMCVSQYAGAGYETTSLINTQNFTARPIIHEASITGITGIITPLFVTNGGVRETDPSLGDLEGIIPVDYQKSGSLDMIGLSGSILRYYDDAYTNQNVDIEEIDPDTGNPVCENEIISFSVTISDEESDAGNCRIEETYSNGTFIAYHDNTTWVTFPSSVGLDYNADAVGTYLLNFQCKDQYHSAYDEETYVIRVSNDTSECNYKTEGDSDPISFTRSADEVSDETFDDDVDTFFGGIGVASPKAKALIGILIIVLCCLAIFKATGSPMLAALGIPAGVLTTLLLGLVDPLVLVVFFVFAAVIIVIGIFKFRGG